MLTIPQYELMMKSARLKQVDRDYRNHLQAYLNFAVKAERKSGKNKTTPVYRKFKKFYNYEREIERVINPNRKSRYAGIGELLRKEGEENV